MELFRFIDWVLVLPEKYEVRFERAVNKIEEADRMRYVTSIERRAIQRGIEQGIEQGTVRATRDRLFAILRLKFPSVPQELLKQIEQIEQIAGVEQLKLLIEQAVCAGTLEEFERVLETGR